MDVILSKIWEVGGAAGISLAVLWVIVRGVKKQQDQNTVKLTDVVTDVAVIKTQILSALSVAQDVKEHDREIVGMKKDIDKNSKDINAQHTRIAESKEDIKDFIRRAELTSKH